MAHHSGDNLLEKVLLIINVAYFLWVFMSSRIGLNLIHKIKALHNYFLIPEITFRYLSCAVLGYETDLCGYSKDRVQSLCIPHVAMDIS